MKKYIFTLIIEELTLNNTVNSIIEKVREEERISALIVENNNKIISEMKSILEVVYSDLTEQLKPLDLAVASHFRNLNGIQGLGSNCFGKLIDLRIGGNKEHCGVSRDAIILRLYCPYENGKLTFNPSLVMFAESPFAKTKEVPFTTSDNLINTFAITLEKMYRNNKK
jgi:hypothetical protein